MDINKLNENIELLTNTLSSFLSQYDKPKGSNMLYSDWLKKWFSLYKENSLKPKTLRVYKNYIDNIIIPFLGNIPLNELDGLKIQKMLNSIDRDNTRKKLTFIINPSLDKAVKLMMIPFNPFQSVEIPNYKSKHYLPLEFEQQNKVLMAMKNDLYISVFWVMCCTGMRIGEFLALDLTKDVDYSEKVININKSVDIDTGKKQTTKTEKSNRKIDFVDMLIPHLKYLAFYQSRCGNFTYSMIRCYFWRIYKKLKYKGLNLHTFRHTFISLCYYVGIREKYIQMLAGHSDINVTLNIYTHILKNGDSPLLDYVKLLKNQLVTF